MKYYLTVGIKYADCGITIVQLVCVIACRSVEWFGLMWKPLSARALVYFEELKPKLFVSK